MVLYAKNVVFFRFLRFFITYKVWAYFIYSNFRQAVTLTWTHVNSRELTWSSRKFTWAHAWDLFSFFYWKYRPNAKSLSSKLKLALSGAKDNVLKEIKNSYFVAELYSPKNELGIDDLDWLIKGMTILRYVWVNFWIF